MDTIVAIDGGSTQTRAGRYNASREFCDEAADSGTNPLNTSVGFAAREIAALAARLCGNVSIDVLAAGISGAAQAAIRNELATRLVRLVHVRRVVVTNDLQALLLANAPNEAAVVVVAGTGSSVCVQKKDGTNNIIGGRGPVFGDDGGAYGVSVAGLRAAAAYLDAGGPATQLVEDLPKACGAPDFRELSQWSLRASKREIAALAQVVLDAADAGDEVATSCVTRQAAALAAQVNHGIHASNLPPDVRVLITGGLFSESKRFRKEFEAAMRENASKVRIERPQLEGHRAVLELAFLNHAPHTVTEVLATSLAGRSGLSPTEAPLENVAPIDRLAPRGIVDLMHGQDAEALQAVAFAADVIASLIETAAEKIQAGGRIVYVGAGTSGRLGVLDAAECPPTFGVEPARVIALIAGGEAALKQSIEGAEDDPHQGKADLRSIAPPVSQNDVVIGISASGSAPYVLAALDEAKRLGAATALVCCNPLVACDADVVVAMDTGPEVVTGSTRLKAGGATKLVLNMVSTGAMALSGFVYDGLMVEMRPVNAKLRRRAERIVTKLAGVAPDRAAALLKESQGRISLAVVMARLGMDADSARTYMDEHGGTLRGALDNS